MTNKKHLIKLTSVILVLVLFASLATTLVACKSKYKDGIPGYEEDTDAIAPLDIGIVADLQIIAESLLTDLNNKPYQNYLLGTSSLKMLELSEAILKTAVDNMIAQNVDVAFFIGDLTENNAQESMQAVEKQCARLEKAGIPVFVASGYTDCMNLDYKQCYLGATEAAAKACQLVTTEDFCEIFADYGYTEAVMKDESSLSYMADIPNTKYRLLVLENNEGASSASSTAMPLSEEQFAWIESALLDAQRCGKPTLVMSSLPIAEGNYMSFDSGEKLQQLFIRYGVKYVFSGHTHVGATHVKETESGTLTEITTTCLCSYPCQINYVYIDENYNYTLRSDALATLDKNYIPSTVGSDEYNACITDFATYAKARYRTDFVAAKQYAMEYGTLSDIYADSSENGSVAINLLKKLELYPTQSSVNNTKLEALSQDVLAWMRDVNGMKLYGNGADTVKSICNAFGMQMPSSTYTDCTVLDYIMDVVYRIQEGVFTYSANSADTKLLTCIFYAGIYKIADVDLFTRLNEVTDLVYACDMHAMLQNIFSTGTADLTQNDFIMSFVSLFYPYIKANYSSLYESLRFENSGQLLENFNEVKPFLLMRLPELKVFMNADNNFETSCISIQSGKLYCQELAYSIIIPNIMNAVLYN